MLEISDQQFEQLIAEALDSLPSEHIKNIKNVAILKADWPSPEQAKDLKPGDLLLGLYSGIPLSKRQGMQPNLPDTITLFKIPLIRVSKDLSDLKEQIRHTIWHEIAHYYGLNHSQIRELEH